MWCLGRCVNPDRSIDGFVTPWRPEAGPDSGLQSVPLWETPPGNVCGNNWRSARQTDQTRRPASFLVMINPVVESAAHRLEALSWPASVVYAALHFLVGWTFLLLGKRGGDSFQARVSTYPAKRNSPWFIETWIKARLCLHVCSVHPHVSGVVLQGEGEGQRGQGPAAEWTPVQHRRLSGPQHVCGVW